MMKAEIAKETALHLINILEEQAPKTTLTARAIIRREIMRIEKQLAKQAC